MNVVDYLQQDQPKFHLADRDTAFVKTGEEVNWNILPGTLNFIEKQARGRTLETGSGASTVVFAAAGTDHTAISPVPHEHQRIAEYCESKEISTQGVTFIAEPSDAVVGDLEERLDFVLLDGTHLFPHAIVEWHYLGQLLNVGGLMLVDDVPIPSVNPLYRFLDADEGWEQVEILDGRTIAFRKLREVQGGSWRFQRINDSYPDYSHLPLPQRINATAQIKVGEVRSWLGAKLRPVQRS